MGSLCLCYLYMTKVFLITVDTRSTETLHTSAKAPVTSVAISVPPSGESVRDHHHNCIICSVANCKPSLKILCKSVRKLLRKVADRQIDKQTNTDDCISSMAQVISTLTHTTPSSRIFNRNHIGKKYGDSGIQKRGSKTLAAESCSEHRQQHVDVL